MVNETLGRHGGDEALKLVARRLQAACDANDSMACLGADGFAIVVRDCGDAPHIAQTVERRFLACFTESYLVNGTQLRLAAKAGIALFPADSEDADALFRNAEAALKKARGSSERLLFYTADMNAQAAQALSLENRLRTAIESEQFILHYQPKIQTASGSLCGVEALIRWQDPSESGLVPPAKFIPILEDTGMILEVGAWAIRKALADHDAWRASGLKPPRVAVNVSQIQLRHKHFVAMVREALAASKCGASGLEFEITESLIMEDVEANITKLNAVRDLGVDIAIDDFGTGYSSLSHLARLPINALKVDRSFIANMAQDSDNMSIVSTIVSLAHSLKLKVIAEGVETAQQSQYLKLLRCDEMQGYLLGKPMPVAQLSASLQANESI
jgi:diguanylate cyclase (GGDEF)-like protein